MRSRRLVLVAVLAWSVAVPALAQEIVEPAAPAPERPPPVPFPLAPPPRPPVEAAETEAEQEEERSDEVDAAQETTPEAEELRLHTGDVLVQARGEDLFQAGGSVHRLDEAALGRLRYNDPLAVLTQVPGVYVRSEDGFGLRPNIGIRGATSERSRKITLMEDGVLVAPAPYAAPAAYFFPMMARMTGIEVTAGAAAIMYGPHTVGGAIDLIGRQIPLRREGRIDLSLGNTWYGRVHLHYGDSNEWGGFLIEGLHVRSSGFHELDAAPGVSRDTGFHRSDILVRGELHGDLDRNFYHRFEVTLGVGLEQSNETYLGTSDADFRANPYRRYAATQLDHMEWWRTRIQAKYEITSGENFTLTVTAYRHDFQRTWQRLDHFCDNLQLTPQGQRDTCNATVGFDRILQNPMAYQSQYERLTGTLDAQARDAPLIVMRNHRQFVSQGIQAVGRGVFDTGEFHHRVNFGARLHYDAIDRNHTGNTYVLEQQQMVLRNSGLEIDWNHDHATAVSLFASWAITWKNLTLSPGARTELIWMHHLDRFTGNVVDGEQYALLPGLGAQYALLPELAIFGGAHLGFSPVAPGQGPEVLPELAWNYELGARYGRITEPTHGELTLFVSDYSNLSGVCSLASGCSEDLLDQQFNGGAVLIMGIEAEASHTIQIDEVSIPLAASYTWTRTRFKSNFESDNPQYGSVREGYELPYVPEHQLSMRAGVTWSILRISVNGLYSGRMRDVAGQGAGVPTDWTDDYFMLDAMASVEAYRGFRIYLRGENLTDTRAILTRRAWGARGPKPVLVQAGIEIDID